MLRIFQVFLTLVLLSNVCLADRTHFEEGIFWKNKGNYVEAIKHFELAKEQQPNNEKVIVEFANAAFKIRRYAQAIVVYENILKSKPNDITALVRLAKMFSYSSKKHKSVEYGERAIKLNPKNQEDLLILGDAFFFVSHYPKAIKMYQKIQPETESTLHKIAKSYNKMSAFNSAAKTLEKLIALKSKPDPTLHYEYGNALYHNGQFRLSTLQFLKAKELGFYNPKMVNEKIAAGFLALNAYEPALEFLIEAKKSAPYSKAVNLDIVNCYCKLNKFKEARNIIEELQEANPNDADLTYSYGMIYYKQGNTTKAERYFEEAFKLKPSLRNLRYTKTRF